MQGQQKHVEWGHFQPSQRGVIWAHSFCQLIYYKNRGILPPKWMVKIMEHPINMDDLRAPPPFLETPKWISSETSAVWQRFRSKHISEFTTMAFCGGCLCVRNPVFKLFDADFAWLKKNLSNGQPWLESNCIRFFPLNISEATCHFRKSLPIVFQIF